MALTRTTLTSAITANQLTFGVASTAASGFPAVGAAPLTAQPLTIDGETMMLVSSPALNTITVRSRGSNGSAAVGHDVGAAVVTGLASEFPAFDAGQSTLQPLTSADIVTYGQDGAIAIPTGWTIAKIAKGSAAALTLGAPPLARDGLLLSLVSLTAFAHVVTTPGVTGLTGLFQYDASGGPFTTMTFIAQPGTTVDLIAQGGFWVVNAPPAPASVTLA